MMKKLPRRALLASASFTFASFIFAGVAMAETMDAKAFQEAFLAGDLSWEEVVAQAQAEGEVYLHYWGGSDPINVWMDTEAAGALEAQGVTLKPVRITNTKDSVDVVLAEKNAGKGVGEGSIDLIWINGENFYTLKSLDAVFGSFVDDLPNAKNFDLDEESTGSLLNYRDFGVPTDLSEVPWSGEQYVCALNRELVGEGEEPANFAELKAYLEDNPGKFTYVKPPHYLGNTFVQEVVYAFNPDETGAEPFQNSLEELGAEELARLIEPGMEYLKALSPMLLGNDGKPRFPEDEAALDGLFLNGETHFSCKFGLYAVATGLAQGTYPEEAEAFIFPEGNMIKNKNYLVIPSNAPNPAAAIVLANVMSEVDLQASKLQMTGMPAGIDASALDDADKAKLAAAAPDLHGVTQADLDANIAPDTHASLVDVIEQVWLEYIERGSEKSVAELVAEAAKAE